MPKVLVVGHTYMPDINRQKYIALSNVSTDYEIVVVTPEYWHDDLVVLESHNDEMARLQFVALKTFFHGRESVYFYRNRDLRRILETLKPDVVLVEQGANALCYFQVLRLIRKLNLRAKCAFFTWENLPYKLDFFRQRIEAYNLRHTDLAFVGNRDGQDILRQRGFTGWIEVIPQIGVDPNTFSYRVSHDKTCDVPIIGFAGRLIQEKGLHTLMAALERLRSLSWKFLVVGKGDLLPDLMQWKKKEGFADRVEILDAVPHHEVPGMMQKMDVFVLPSETASFWKEQFGHVLVEAMSSGVPVIGSDSGEIPHVIGDAGLVFLEGDVQALAECLKRLIVDKGLREDLAEKGYRRVIDHYTHDAIAHRLDGIFAKLIKGDTWHSH